MLKKISGSTRQEVTGGMRKLHLRSFMICSDHQMLFGDQMKEDEIRGAKEGLTWR